ncbi:MAG: ADP-ribosylglycohydrolase family protein [Clostridia bacterium]|nr:ADP-ribosylglycohydrolase family protein [Clostridia bacterium]
MYGAILGDIIGSPYEFEKSKKTKEFPLFIPRSRYTDDSAMTIAVAEALLDTQGTKNREERKEAVTRSMQKWGRRYPDAGYGGRFYDWLYSRDPQPYRSWGNGSAMRVSSAGWLFETLEETLEAAEDTAAVTHNHPEGIRGAKAAAAVIWAARNGWSKAKIREYAEQEFYPLKQTCDEIRPGYHFDVSCQGTVPQAITAFLEGKDFEDVIRTAVSLGGDCDTLTCIAGGMAEAMYGVPEYLKAECRKRLEPDMLEVLDRFEKARIRLG